MLVLVFEDFTWRYVYKVYEMTQRTPVAEPGFGQGGD